MIKMLKSFQCLVFGCLIAGIIACLLGAVYLHHKDCMLRAQIDQIDSQQKVIVKHIYKKYVVFRQWRQLQHMGVEQHVAHKANLRLDNIDLAMLANKYQLTIQSSLLNSDRQLIDLAVAGKLINIFQWLLSPSMLKLQLVPTHITMQHHQQKVELQISFKHEGE